jgi:hypothetical protein
MIGMIGVIGSLQEMLSTCEQFHTLWDRYHKTLALTNQLVALRREASGGSDPSDTNTEDPTPSTPLEDVATATMADLGIGSPSSTT